MEYVHSSTLVGYEAHPVDVEIHLSNNLPNIQIIGLANKSVDESKERLRSSFAYSELHLPRKRITINLSPANIPKNDTNIDLAMAVAILSKSKQINQNLSQSIFLGELGLDGKVKPIQGLLSHLECAHRTKLKRAFIPYENYTQAKLFKDIEILPVKNLKQLFNFFNAGIKLNKPKSQKLVKNKPLNSFNKIIGQKNAKQALVISASGGHNLLFEGPPGGGKSMLAKAYLELLPDLTDHEMIEVTRVHSLKNNNKTLVSERPFRSPHHSASHISIVGGGNKPSPGEITLAHHGVLFLDEIAEFDRRSLEALRQPLEDNKITITRANFSSTYPANFTLIATQNPCPCGNYNSKKACQCSLQQINKYQQKLSGPLIDRIDIYCFVKPIKHRKLINKSYLTDTINDVKRTINNARRVQIERQGKLNSHLSAEELSDSDNFTNSCKEMIIDAAEKLALSSRGLIKVLRVAQTIADIDASPTVQEVHVLNALSFRKKETVSI